MKLKLTILAVGVVLCASAATVTEGWRTLNLTNFARNLKRADVNIAEQTIAQIHKVFLADPALSPTPTGLLVIPNGSVGYGPSSPHSASSLPFRRDLVPYDFRITLLHPKQYCPNGSNCRIDIGEGPSLGVNVNTPVAALFRPRPFENTEATPENRWYFAPKKIGDVAGFPLYENGRVVITKTQRPLWIAVTREEFVRNEVQKARQYLDHTRSSASQNKSNAAYLQSFIQRSEQNLQKLEQKLSTLSDRSAPAYCCTHKGGQLSELAEPNEQAIQPVVRLNKDFFDSALSPGTAQVITVDTPITIDLTLGKGHKDRPLIEDIINKLDWQGLAALVR